MSTHVFDDEMAFFKARGILMADIGGKEANPRVTILKEGNFEGGHKDFEQWSRNGKTFVETTWRLSWIKQFSAGDGTVPSDSQLAESSKIAKKRLTRHTSEMPVHMNSTKSDDVWRALVTSVHADAIAAPDAAEIAALKGQEVLPRTTGSANLPFEGDPPL
jgi:hypothetical protein